MPKLPEIIINKHYIRRINGNIAAYAAHGNAGAGFFQRRGIINTVAKHTNMLALIFVTGNNV